MDVLVGFVGFVLGIISVFLVADWVPSLESASTGSTRARQARSRNWLSPRATLRVAELEEALRKERRAADAFIASPSIEGLYQHTDSWPQTDDLQRRR